MRGWSRSLCIAELSALQTLNKVVFWLKSKYDDILNQCASFRSPCKCPLTSSPAPKALTDSPLLHSPRIQRGASVNPSQREREKAVALNKTFLMGQGNEGNRRVTQRGAHCFTQRPGLTDEMPYSRTVYPQGRARSSPGGGGGGHSELPLKTCAFQPSLSF